MPSSVTLSLVGALLLPEETSTLPSTIFMPPTEGNSRKPAANAKERPSRGRRPGALKAQRKAPACPGGHHRPPGQCLPTLQTPAGLLSQSSVAGMEDLMECSASQMSGPTGQASWEKGLILESGFHPWLGLENQRRRIHPTAGDLCVLLGQPPQVTGYCSPPCAHLICPTSLCIGITDPPCYR